MNSFRFQQRTLSVQGLIYLCSLIGALEMMSHPALAAQSAIMDSPKPDIASSSKEHRAESPATERLTSESPCCQALRTADVETNLLPDVELSVDLLPSRSQDFPQQEPDHRLDALELEPSFAQSNSTVQVPLVDTDISTQFSVSQLPDVDQDTSSDPLAPVLRQDAEPPSTEPLVEPETPTPLPPPAELLQPSPTTPVVPPGANPEDIPDTVIVDRFEVIGSTVFSAAEFDAVTREFTNRPLTFAELFQVRNAVTQLYVENGYVTSGAYIPPQLLDTGIVQIQVVEGTLEDIVVTNNRHLNSEYVRSRLSLVAGTPLNVDRLLEGLQLLQLDPLINSISAELATGVEPGTSLLNVEIDEADPFSAEIGLDNGRSPAVGSFRRSLNLTHANLFGLGDRLSVEYANTDGSDAVDASYTVPVNPRNGTLSFSVGLSSSDIIEAPFDVLDIESESRYYELTYRQPIVQTPTEEFAIGLTASRQESQSEFLEDFGDPIPFPSIGADEDGRINISVLRFTQDWTRRGQRNVFAARSQFSLGLDALDSTVNQVGPDSRFLSWRGQGQWVHLLAPDTLFVLRSDLQLTGDELLPQEQFGIGGQQTVRGYRQDQLLTDNGFLASAEVRVPILRVRDINGLLQIIPFIDFGMGWNNGNRPAPDPDSLISAGLGLQWQMSDRFSARLDWGIPLVVVDSEGDSLQEEGLHFSLNWRPF